MLLGNPVSQLNKKGDGNSRNPKYELNTVAMFASKVYLQFVGRYCWLQTEMKM